MKSPKLLSTGTFELIDVPVAAAELITHMKLFQIHVHYIHVLSILFGATSFNIAIQKGKKS